MDPARLPPLLIPSPRRVDVGSFGLDAARTRSPPTVAHDPGLAPEGYRLRTRHDGAIIETKLESATDAGRRHALATLVQLHRQYGASMPELEIEDAPALSGRGLMLDVSRTRVPTMARLREVVSLLGSLKLNHLQLYTEHAFAYEGHEDVWRGCSPITSEEVKRLDGWCREAGITLAANQNCFGHLARWLRLPRYAHLAETHAEYDFYGQTRRGPMSLCPTDPDALAFVEGLLDQLLPCFSSGLVNIGCDETADIGTGRSAAEARARGVHAVYAEFVATVARAAIERGSRPMFWADIALEHPDTTDALPVELIALAWGYEPDCPFERWCETLRLRGREAWVCPGTSSWRSFTGRTTERRGNITRAARAGHRHGARGLLVTDWGDEGHLQQWTVSLPAIAQAAQAAWNPDAPEPDPRAVSLHVLGDRSLRAAAWLDALGDVDEPLRRVGGRPLPDGTRAPLRNSSAVFCELIPDRPDRTTPGSPEDWLAVRERLDHLGSRMPFAPGSLARDELSRTIDLCRCGIDAALGRLGSPDAAPMSRDRIDDMIQSHRRLWRVGARAGELDESCGILRGALERIGPGQ